MIRFYRLLLRLYPRPFRAEYEREIEALFEQQMRGRSRLAMIAGALADVVPNAIASHAELVRQDLHSAARSLRRAPGFAITAILVAALGVGANTAAFSLADFVLVRPLPFPDSDRLVKLRQGGDGWTNEISPANFRDWREQSRSFEALGAFTIQATNLVGRGEPRRLESILATPEVLPLVGVQPLLGRHFTRRDAESSQPVIISYALWQSQFGADPGVIGRTVRLDGAQHTVFGVMPASFHFPHRGVEAWRPLVLTEEDFEDRGNTYLVGVGRLRHGVTVDEARGELAVVAERLHQYPENEGVGAYVIRVRDEISQNARVLVLALCGAALSILLLACANVASLFLARSEHRARELAVRSALGAGRDRLIRQVVTESFAIAAIGGLLGVGVAVAAVPLLTRLVPSSLPIAQYPSVDLRVLGIVAGFVVLTGVAFGLAPALRLDGRRLIGALRDGTRGGGGRRQPVRAGLIVLEIVATVVLLVSAGLLIRAVWNLQSRHPGFESDDVLVVRTALPLPKYEAITSRARFFTGVLERVRALPGVEAAGYVTGVPMDLRGLIWTVSFGELEPRRDGSDSVALRFVTPGYFAAMRIPLVRGRDVAEEDRQDQPHVAVVSESFVRRHFPPDVDPIGRTFTVALSERTIVGIVGDVRTRGLERQSEPQVYLSYRQIPDGSLIGYVPKELVVRSASLESLLPAIRAIVREVDPEQPVSHVRTLESIVSDETASRATQARLLISLAVIALLIAGLGVHGLLTYTVSIRTRELGVRQALGAERGAIVRLVVREGIVLASIGVALGLFVAYLFARGMSALLVGVRPYDPLTITLAVAVCFVTVVVGSLRPALQATRVDPTVALRAD